MNHLNITSPIGLRLELGKSFRRVSLSVTVESVHTKEDGPDLLSYLLADQAMLAETSLL